MKTEWKTLPLQFTDDEVDIIFHALLAYPAFADPNEERIKIWHGLLIKIFPRGIEAVDEVDGSSVWIVPPVEATKEDFPKEI